MAIDPRERTGLSIYSSNDNKDAHPTLLFGRLCEDARIEAIAVRRTKPHAQWTASGVSSMIPGRSHALIQFQHQRGPWATDLSFHSNGSLIGAQTAYQIPSTPLSIGGEIFYTHSERSGGLSLGARYRREDEGLGETDIVLSLNPMMVRVITN